MKNPDKKALCQVIFSIIPREKVAELVLYGSNKFGSDIDIFVILHGYDLYSSFSVGEIDFTIVGAAWLPTLIQNLDPIVIEPILTGERIYGREILPAKDEIKRRRGTINAADYLLQCSDICLAWATDHLDKKNFRASACCLVFAISYLLYAKRYALGRRVMIFKNLRVRMECQDLDRANSIFKGKKSPPEEDLVDLIENIHKSLTDMYNCLIVSPRLKREEKKPE